MNVKLEEEKEENFVESNEIKQFEENQKKIDKNTDKVEEKNQKSLRSKITINYKSNKLVDDNDDMNFPYLTDNNRIMAMKKKFSSNN